MSTFVELKIDGSNFYEKCYYFDKILFEEDVLLKHIRVYKNIDGHILQLSLEEDYLLNLETASDETERIKLTFTESYTRNRLAFGDLYILTTMELNALQPNKLPKDEKRFAIIPLSFENRERALPGEIVLNEETGDIYVKSKHGDLRCATSEVSDKVKEIVDSRMETLKYALNNNRAVYRFYFDNTMVRLDSSLDLPEEYVYFQVRDIKRDTKYYLDKLTRVNKTGFSLYPEDTTGNVIDALHHNGTYFVEFYNISLELVSQLVFTAKRVPGAGIDDSFYGGGLDKFINYITVVPNRSILYVGEDIKAINTRVYAVMGDSSKIDITNTGALLSYKETSGKLEEIDITDDPLTFTDLSKIDTKKPGFYKIRATFINRLDGRELEASTIIEVAETPDQQLMQGNDSIVLVPVYSAINDNFTMKCIGYFEDGTIRDITGDVTLSPNILKPIEGVVEQKVTVIFNEGQIFQTSIDKEVNFFTAEGLDSYLGQHAAVRLPYNNSNEKLLMLPSEFLGNGAVRYRVRHVDSSLGDAGYYTGTQYGYIGYAIQYSNVLSKDIVDGQELIVELYNKNLGFTGAILLHAQYTEAENLK